MLIFDMITSKVGPSFLMMSCFVDVFHLLPWSCNLDRSDNFLKMNVHVMKLSVIYLAYVISWYSNVLEKTLVLPTGCLQHNTNSCLFVLVNTVMRHYVLHAFLYINCSIIQHFRHLLFIMCHIHDCLRLIKFFFILFFYYFTICPRSHSLSSLTDDLMTKN